MPTLIDLAGLPMPALCPPDSRHTAICREGRSLTPVLADPAGSRDSFAGAAFMQDAACMHDEGVWHDACSHPDAPHVMGYALRTRRWRYVEWVRFDKHQAAPLWDQGPVGTELYDHTENDTVANVAESVNVVARPENAAVVARLSRMLRAGWRNASTEGL